MVLKLLTVLVYIIPIIRKRWSAKRKQEYWRITFYLNEILVQKINRKMSYKKRRGLISQKLSLQCSTWEKIRLETLKFSNNGNNIAFDK